MDKNLRDKLLEIHNQAMDIQATARWLSELSDIVLHDRNILGIPKVTALVSRLEDMAASLGTISEDVEDMIEEEVLG